MADFTPEQLENSIINALLERDRLSSRGNNGQYALLKETKKILEKIAKEVSQSEKQKIKDAKDLSQKVTDMFNTMGKGGGKGGSGNISKQTADATSSIASAFKREIPKFASKMASLAVAFGAQMMKKFIDVQVTASQKISSTVREMDTAGVVMGYQELQDTLKDSVISLDEISKSAKTYSQTFAILNKQTGNAAKTFTELTNGAHEYSQKNNIAMTQEQLSKYTGEYLESQRKMGGLDRMTQKQQQEGVNKFIQQVENISKTFGIDRDKLTKGGGINDASKLQLLADGNPELAAKYSTIMNQLEGMGMSDDSRAAIQAYISGGGNINDPRLAKFAAESGLLDALDNSNVGRMARLGNKEAAMDAFTDPNSDFYRQYNSTMSQRIAGMGSNAYNIASKVGGGYMGMMQDYAAIKSYTDKKKTDDTNTKEDKNNAAKQNLENQKLRAASMSKEAYGAYLDTDTALKKGMADVVGYLADIKKLLAEKLPWLSRFLGGAGAVISNLAGVFGMGSVLKTGWNIAKSIPKIGRIAKAGRLGTALKVSKSTGAISKAGTGLKQFGKGALKYGGRAAAGLGLGIAGELTHQYGAKGLQKLGVGEKTANNVANYAGSAMKGAAWGAMFGPMGMLVGAGVGLIAQGAKDAWDKWGGGKKKEEQDVAADAKKEEEQKKEVENLLENPDEEAEKTQEQYNSESLAQQKQQTDLTMEMLSQLKDLNSNMSLRINNI